MRSTQRSRKIFFFVNKSEKVKTYFCTSPLKCLYFAPQLSMKFPVAGALASSSQIQTQPNPPNFPPSVQVFTSLTPTDLIDSKIQAAFAENGGSPTTSCNNGEFSDSRYAFLFAPGNYTNDVPVGFYTSIYGAGKSPYETQFTGDRGVYAEEGCGAFDVGALTTFWRSAENFHTHSAYEWAVGVGMTWAVSQAAPLRNVVIDNSLMLFEYIDGDAAGYASGGWGSGLTIGGEVGFGSQQQFMIRSSTSSKFQDTVWNGVFVGNENPPPAACGIAETDTHQSQMSVVDTVPLVAEKPFIRTDEFAQKVSEASRKKDAPGRTSHRVQFLAFKTSIR